MRMVKGLEEKPCEVLRALDSLEKRILRAELIVGCSFLRGSPGATLIAAACDH